MANVRHNVDKIKEHLGVASEHQADIALFPELCLSGYTCADLFYQKKLLNECEDALREVAEASQKYQLSCAVGLPFFVDGRLYNTAAFISHGDIVGLVPKSHLPNRNEYYEGRWFSAGPPSPRQELILHGRKVFFGTHLLFQPDDFRECILGIELCEDLWAPNPPSSEMSLSGANVFLNLSASNETLGKLDYRRSLVEQQSARCLSAYLYASAGPNESTTDTVFSGHCLTYENGILLAESERFRFEGTHIVADIDVERLNHDRLKNTIFSESPSNEKYIRVSFKLGSRNKERFTKKLYRPIVTHPFVPQEKGSRSKTCEEIFSIQTAGLTKRLRLLGCRKNVIGLSGGLDSTLALLVMLQTYKNMGYPVRDIIAVTMPGPGTTHTTKNNAQKLCEQLGTSLRVIDISSAVKEHLREIAHPDGQHDITFENSQARERTQILMDVANQVGGIVVGTGDLSELALGWCTYNGDQMSMYHVNAGVPKTLVRYLIEWFADTKYEGEVQKLLKDVSNTPITPELLPPDGDRIVQKTEEAIGPYELHDFFLYYVVRHGFTPKKILFLAETAFVKTHSRKEIKKWLLIFYKRFFQNQFKRSAMPDGVKIGSVALSPRADWRMPSDAEARIWLDELKTPGL